MEGNLSMFTLGISLLSNMIVWSIVFFFLRKIQPAPRSGMRHLSAKTVYTGKRTANPQTLLPLFCFFLILIFIVFFASPHLTTWTARASGAGFVCMSFLSYLYLLKAFRQGAEKE